MKYFSTDELRDNFSINNTEIRKYFPDFPRGISIKLGTSNIAGVITSGIELGLAHALNNDCETRYSLTMVPEVRYKAKGKNEVTNLVYGAAHKWYKNHPYFDMTKRELIEAVCKHAYEFIQEAMVKNRRNGDSKTVFDDHLDNMASYLARKPGQTFWRCDPPEDGHYMQAQMVYDTFTQWYEEHYGLANNS